MTINFGGHWLDLTHAKCLEETSDASPSDEIYVIFFVGRFGVAGLPGVKVGRNGPHEDFDEGEVRVIHQTVWGLDGLSNTPLSPTQVIILASMIEHDSGNPA